MMWTLPVLSLALLPVSIVEGFAPAWSSQDSSMRRTSPATTPALDWSSQPSLMNRHPVTLIKSSASTTVLSASYDGVGDFSRHSARDWIYNLKSLPQSAILKEVKHPLLAVTGWSFVVSLIQKSLNDMGLRTMASQLCIPGTAHSFLVSALGLLLVFRTNSSYQRFAEGRKIWEDILNISRNLSRMIELYSKEIGKERQAVLVRLIAAYPYLLRDHIRPGCLCESPKGISKKNRLLISGTQAAPVDARYEGDKTCQKPSFRRNCWVDRTHLPWSLFTNEPLEKMARAKNRPLWVCDRLGKVIMGIKYGPNFTSRERLTMLSMVGKLTNALGQCERIHQTAVPLNYARHSLRSLTLWLFTLPFALVKDMGMLTAPVVGSIAWLLYGIYQIGYSIEDPFQGSLRLSTLCDSIRCDVLGSVSDDFEDRQTAYDEENWDGPFDGHGRLSSDRLSYGHLISPISDDAVSAFLRDTTPHNGHKIVQLMRGAGEDIDELLLR